MNIFSDCDILTIEEILSPPLLVSVGTKKPAVYAKIKKPIQFIEMDLSEYRLYSVITGKRIKEIQDKDFRSFHFRRLALKNRIMNALLKIGGIVFSKM